MRANLCSTFFLAVSVIAGGIRWSQAQALSGVVRFANDMASGVNAPFHDVDGTTPLAGATFRAALYVGQIGSPPETWIRMSGGQSFRSGPFAGFWTSIDVPIIFPAGGAVVLQVRFWDSVNGAFTSYEEAEASGAPIGVSRAIAVVLNNPPAATPMIGLQSAGLVPTLTLTRGAPGIVTDSTATANGTQQSALCGVPVGTSRWFRLATAYPGEALVGTGGSAIDTVVGAYTGSIISPSTLTPITCNDDREAGVITSEARFPVEPNKLYLLCVAGKNGAAGPIRLKHTLATSLFIRRSADGGVEISWPADATNFVPEASGDFPDPSAWRVITNTPLILQNRRVIQLDCAAPHAVYRLRLNDPLPVVGVR